MKVFVATYEHKHGSDVRVFDSAEKAAAWKEEIADEWWDAELPDEERPDCGPIGDAYFDAMVERGKEFFGVEECDVE